IGLEHAGTVAAREKLRCHCACRSAQDWCDAVQPAGGYQYRGRRRLDRYGRTAEIETSRRGNREVSMNLRNATALITGGSSGIGFAIAKVLIDAGNRVAITGRDEKKLYKAAEMLHAVPIRADVTNEADIVRTYREVFQAFAELDILVNNAGSGVFRKLVDMDRASFEAVFANECDRSHVDGPRSRETFHPAEPRQHYQ